MSGGCSRAIFGPVFDGVEHMLVHGFDEVLAPPVPIDGWCQLVGKLRLGYELSGAIGELMKPKLTVVMLEILSCGVGCADGIVEGEFFDGLYIVH